MNEKQHKDLVTELMNTHTSYLIDLLNEVYIITSIGIFTIVTNRRSGIQYSTATGSFKEQLCALIATIMLEDFGSLSKPFP
jgi:hypothetical protein